MTPNDSSAAPHRYSALLVVAAFVAWFAGIGVRPAAAQRLPATSAAPAPAAEIAGPLAAAREALAAGKLDEAARHARVAVELRPRDPAALKEALAAAAGDPDAALLWTLAWLDATADAEGRPVADPAAVKLLAEGKALRKIPAARAAAAKELAAFGRASVEGAAAAAKTRLGARYAAGLLLAAVGENAALATAAAELDPLLENYPPDVRPLVAALERLVQEKASTADPALALRAALVLIALGRQAAYPDLRGPKPPDLSGPAAQARRALDHMRAEAAKRAAPLTVEELRAMTPAERGVFTREHASWTNPGVAVSPGGLYRIETVCGFETLLGAAETIEFHHARLVAWFGGDPFVGRPGLIRIVPEHGSLEGEGAPFWWAGGFQQGDVTTAVFAVGDIEGLGRTLVHELTHRFDGARHPFLPAWASEGRAVWTGAAYGSSRDAAFNPRHASFGTVETAFIKGYGDPKNLAKLLTGAIDDYRDNYPAGYALFLYLDTWEEDGRRIFRPKLPAYLQGGLKGRSRPQDWFVACFVDGKDGRPAKFEDFATGFAAFLKGFYWQSRAAWLDRYTQVAGKSRASPWVYDGPTWVHVRSRAEPWFGQDQARRGGDVLFDAGRKKEALFAYGFALEVDEPALSLFARFATLADELGAPALAYAARAEAARIFDRPSPGPAPFLAALPRTQALLSALADAANEAAAAGAPLAAACFAADHDRLAAPLGVPALARRADLAAFGRPRHPGDPPARPLGEFGYAEDGLTDFEEKRVKDLWFVAENGDLHVGRAKPRDGTGNLDRALWQRHAFTRTKAWIPAGRYVIEGRVLFTTSYFSGAVVLGYRRADRVVRLHFSGGDFLYSLGTKEKAAKLDRIGWHVAGRRPRDGGLHGSSPGGSFQFPGERSSFRFTLLVDGPELQVFLDDVWVGSYADPEGAAIEGHVGFAADQGAVQIQEARVRRLDRGRVSGLRLLREDGFALTADGALREHELLNRRVRGFDPGPHGALIVFAAPPEKAPASPEEEIFEWDGLLEIARGLPGLLEAEKPPQRVVVALPEGLSAEKLAEFRQVYVDRGGADEAEIIVHRRKTPVRTFRVEGRPPAAVPTLILVDPQGFYRAHADFVGRPESLPEPVRHWVRALRGRT